MVILICAIVLRLCMALVCQHHYPLEWSGRFTTGSQKWNVIGLKFTRATLQYSWVKRLKLVDGAVKKQRLSSQAEFLATTRNTELETLMCSSQISLLWTNVARMSNCCYVYRNRKWGYFLWSDLLVFWISWLWYGFSRFWDISIGCKFKRNNLCIWLFGDYYLALK